MSEEEQTDDEPEDEAAIVEGEVSKARKKYCIMRIPDGWNEVH